MRSATAIASLTFFLLLPAGAEARTSAQASRGTALQSLRHQVIAADERRHRQFRHHDRRHDIGLATLPWLGEFGDGAVLVGEDPVTANPPSRLALAAAPRPAAAAPLPPCREKEGDVEIIRGGACAR